MIAGLLVIVAAVLGALLGQNSAGASGRSSRQVQWDLAGLGYLPWSGIDGADGPQTKGAVRSFQSDRCLAVDRVAGPQTDGAPSSAVSSVQGKVGATRDGAFGPKTKSAVIAWQRAHKLTADGQAGPATMKAMGVTRSASCGGGSGRGSPLATEAVSIAKAQEGGLVWYADDGRGPAPRLRADRDGRPLQPGRPARGRPRLLGHRARRLRHPRGHLRRWRLHDRGAAHGRRVKSISITWYADNYRFMGANRPH